MGGFGSSCERVSDHVAIGSVLCLGLIGSKHVWETVAEVISASRFVRAACRLDLEDPMPITGNEMILFYQSMEPYVIKTQLAPDNHQ